MRPKIVPIKAGVTVICRITFTSRLRARCSVTQGLGSVRTSCPHALVYSYGNSGIFDRFQGWKVISAGVNQLTAS
jgi:hypothetical protein